MVLRRGCSSLSSRRLQRHRHLASKLADYGEEKAAELLHDNNMSISSLQWIGGFTGSDGRSYRDSLHDGLDAIQLAADLRAECVVVLAGGRSGHTSNHAHRLLRAALKELAEAAEAVGVQLALEPMHIGCAHEWTFINTVPNAWTLSPPLAAITWAWCSIATIWAKTAKPCIGSSRSCPLSAWCNWAMPSMRRWVSRIVAC